ncbi:hypothetical protein N656DRAFT_780295 [Canariomyces notabilis]|uniref:Uncharacterized protein n=1 Tax=Canariomyces notabilis TaxID=2074819 RepID=A0AAN6TC28_9PEZI|nr:hypothetical protein N656DRAFT_780295 [Canariomyces arenarius]
MSTLTNMRCGNGTSAPSRVANATGKRTKGRRKSHRETFAGLRRQPTQFSMPRWKVCT